MDTSLKLMSMDSGAGREYQYDVDECLLWVTDFNPSMQCIGKRHFRVSQNPIEQIRLKATSNDDISLEDPSDLDID